MHILYEISNVPFDISLKILNPWSANDAFYWVLKFHELWLWHLKS